ncbi:tetratricopeptide repeat protein, partial [Polaribacter sp.]|uniref:tetratricopeptide repeat protein n=1 Tax=Polaribacter sp. TaxID=1920175 RepID=UPI003F6D5694
MELKKIFYCFLLLFQTLIIAQETSVNNTDKQFFVQVKVEIKKTKTPIKNADVSVNGKSFYFSEIDGFYKVEARVGDQLVVSHPDFDDVYYTITSNEEIKVVIEGFNPQNLSLYKRKDSFVSYLDSAKFYKTKDIDKSLSFIEKAIKTSKTRDRNAKTYGTLASVYLHWKQYDLAVNNYKLSLQIKENTTAKIGLAKALFNLKEYDKAITAYKKIEQTALSKFEQIVVLEGLADTYFAIKKYTLAKEQFNKAFNIANKNKVNSKITDISSKIAAVFAAEGNLKEANLNYNKSLKFAAKENVNRVLKEEEKVADFLNENKKYDEEIKLRKKSLVKANQKKIAAPQKEIVADSITSQKINYKIGNAYLLKEDYKEAIPFLEKSRKDAKKNKDIVV